MAANSFYTAVPAKEEPYVQESSRLSVSDSGQHGRASRKLKSPFRGWRFGVAMSSAMGCLVLAVNVALTIVAATTYSSSIIAGIGTIMEGSCDMVNDSSTGLHIVINVLSSLMLSASNYTMQCLAAPTRTELDIAHSKGSWLDIGMPSLRNVFGKVSFSRTVVFWILALSSIPIHLLFNSAIFKTIDANLYDIVVANEIFLQGRPFNAQVQMFSRGAPYGWNDYGNETSPPRITLGKATTNYGHLREFQSFFANNTNNETAVQRLERAECIKAYGAGFVSGRSDILLVTSFHNATDDDSNFFWYGNSEIGYPYYDSYAWICNGDSFSSNDCNINEVLATVDYWRINTRNIDYCLSKLTTPRCQLQFSLQILIAVIVCNALKSAAMLWTLFRQREAPVVTVGDAIGSFLEYPDEHSRRHAWIAPTSNPKLLRRRWFSGATRTRWYITIVLCLAGVVTASVYLNMGMNWGQSGKSIVERGFGLLDPGAIIGEGPPQRGFDGLINAVLLANLPQLICSLLYLAYNGLLTSMLLASEWSRYYLRKKPLRVSRPRGQQRSTYWLQLPFTYSIPLLLASTILHWLISQSLFLVRISVYRNGIAVDPPGEEASRIGYSCLPILLVIVMGACLILAAIGLGFRKLEHRMPMVGSNSLHISAQCHRPKDDVDAAYLPVNWGQVDAPGVEGSSGPCCFTSWDVHDPYTAEEVYRARNTAQPYDTTMRERYLANAAS